MAFNPQTGQWEPEVFQQPVPIYDGPELNLRENRARALQAPIAQPMPQAQAEAFGAPSAAPTPAAPDAASPVQPVVTPADMVRPPLPTQSFRETKSINTTVKRTKISDEEKKATAAVAEGFDQQKEIAGKQANLRAEQADIEAKQAAEQERVAIEKEASRARVTEQANAEIARRDANAMAEFEKYKGMEPKSFWRDKGTGDKVLAALAVGMGALGGAMTGRGQNLALQSLQSAIDKDYQAQLQGIEKQRDIYQLAQGQAADARKSKSERLADLNAGFAGRIEAVQARYAALKAKAGVPAAELEGDAIMAALDQKKNDFLRQASEVNRQEVTTNTQRTLVEMDNKAAMGGAAPRGIFGPGGTVIASTGDAKQDEKINEELTPFRQLRDVMVRLKESYAKGNVNPWGEEAANRESLAAEAQGLYNKMAKFGSLDNGTVKVLSSAIGSGSAFRAETQGKRIDTALSSLDRRAASYIDSQGLPGSKVVPLAMGGQVEAPAQPAASPDNRRQIAEAMDWLNKNPNDPRAPAIRARVQQMAAGGR